MPGSKTRKNGMKMYGFLVAIEHDREVPADFVERAIAHFMDDDNNYRNYGKARVDVEALGEIDCYDEE